MLSTPVKQSLASLTGIGSGVREARWVGSWLGGTPPGLASGEPPSRDGATRNTHKRASSDESDECAALFAELGLGVARALSLERVAAIKADITAAIRGEFPDATLTIATRPGFSTTKWFWSGCFMLRSRYAAARSPRHRAANRKSAVYQPRFGGRSQGSHPSLARVWLRLSFKRRP
jgi:hypothetical protein